MSNNAYTMSTFRGAVYFPSKVYNAYQTYEYFNASELERDFSYAEKAGITALRIFTSYEQYLKDKPAFFSKFDILLAIAAKHSIRVMPVLFENCGRDFTPENAMDRDPDTAVCVKSPALKTIQDPSLWTGCLQYAQEFMTHYADDERLVAIEIMNEPDYKIGDVDFALAVLRKAREYKKSVPLTIGCITLQQCLYYGDLIDIYQFHDNFPSEIESFKKELEFASQVKRVTGKPVWLSEWQRLRKSGPGWDKAEIPQEEKTPDLASLAPLVYSSGLGSFFWCLMVKPAYLSTQRPNGTYNGLFYEDGSVYSAADYKAISGKDDIKEKKGLPEWYVKSKETKEKNRK